MTDDTAPSFAARNVRTVPLLPYPDVEAAATFYEVLGFEVTSRQSRPNPYVVVQRGRIELHLFGIAGFDPASSYGSCLVVVPDTGPVFEDFATRMRTAYGKLLVSGLPRITRPRKRANTGAVSAFSLVDPGGNWIRFFPDVAQPSPLEEPTSELAAALRTAVVLGESKGDHAQAAHLLDAKLRHHEAAASVVDRVEALAYRAELATVLGDDAVAEAVRRRVADVPLTDTERALVGDTLRALEDR